jgi:5'-3' exonuclease
MSSLEARLIAASTGFQAAIKALEALIELGENVTDEEIRDCAKLMRDSADLIDPPPDVGPSHALRLIDGGLKSDSEVGGHD